MKSLKVLLASGLFAFLPSLAKADVPQPTSHVQTVARHDRDDWHRGGRWGGRGYYGGGY